jgi:hypothetical protein
MHIQDTVWAITRFLFLPQAGEGQRESAVKGLTDSTVICHYVDSLTEKQNLSCPHCQLSR